MSWKCVLALLGGMPSAYRQKCIIGLAWTVAGREVLSSHCASA